jgi:hypothetical protein
MLFPQNSETEVYIATEFTWGGVQLNEQPSKGARFSLNLLWQYEKQDWF